MREVEIKDNTLNLKVYVDEVPDCQSIPIKIIEIIADDQAEHLNEYLKAKCR